MPAVIVSRGGRVLVAEQVRRGLGCARVEADVVGRGWRVVMESLEQLMARIRREVAESWTGPADTSAAEELISDRRAEAAAEDEQQ
ncbi:AbrB/MazE/SpoVT family DNA-binding domain-containing protein [Pseudonocardia sp. C8]|nr:AbrB/MazE/SpoVT family DNA-binding domain-containing protein [Pseudonocardia sp. C8]